MFELVDYYVSDGWELLYKNLNHQTTADYTYIAFTLYNRYSGTVRVFYYLGDDIEANELVIKMSFVGERNDYTYQRTALFSHLNPVMQPVEVFNNENSFEVSVGDVATGGNHWVYADFPAAYDPCTCGANADVRITAHYVDTRTVNLEGTITGTQQTVVPGSSGGNDGKQIGFGQALSNVNSIFSAANKGYKATTDAAEAYQNLVDRAENNEAGSSTTNATNVLDGTFFGGDAWKSVGDIISLGLNSTSALSAVGTVANLFIGGWKKAKGSNASAPPVQMEVDLGVRVSGTIGRDIPHSEITFRLPGSKVEAGSNDSRAPVYDNVLGTFNVIKQPTLIGKRFTSESIQPDPYKFYQFYSFQLEEPIRFAINPAAKLKAVKIMAQFQYKYKLPEEISDNHVFLRTHGVDPVFGPPVTHMTFPPVGPVLLGPLRSTYPVQSNTTFNFNIPDFEAQNINMPSAEDKRNAYINMVRLYGRGQSVVNWPSHLDTIWLDDLTYGSAILPIEDLQDYKLNIWDPGVTHFDSIEIVLKVYTFFTPEDDPSREPMMQIMTFPVEHDASSELGGTFSFSRANDYHSDQYWVSQAVDISGSNSDRFGSSAELVPWQNTLHLGDFSWGGSTSSPAILSQNGKVYINQSGEIYAGEVLIDRELVLAPGVSVTIYANSFEVKPSAILPPGVSLRPIRSEPENNKATPAQIISMCEGANYQENTTFQRVDKPDLEETDSVSSLTARLFPNPTRTQTTLRYELEAEAQVRISLIDVLGQESILLNSNQAAGTQELTINLRDYPAGLYYCRLMVDGEQQSLPLRVQR